MKLLLRRRPVLVVLGLCIVVRLGAAQNSSDTSGTCSQGNLGNNSFQLSGSNGTFFSPNYPAKYKSNTTCIWIISVPEGKRVMLRFDSDFEVPGSYYPYCTELDFVEMRDGNSSTDRVLGNYCGYGSRNDVQSTGNSMWVKFISNHDKMTGIGFRAHYKAVEAVEVACTYSGWTYDASLLYNQTLTSSNYPLYQDNVADCSGTIRTSNASGYIVKISIKSDFRLGFSSYCKHADTYIQFLDGPTSLSPAIGTFCGYKFPEVVYSTGRYLHVKFVGDSYLSYKGFSFNYSAVLADESSGMCLPNKLTNNNLRLNGSSGTFTTPNYPVNYKEDSRCTWIISVPAGKRIRLTFLYGFHISSDYYGGYNPSCWHDYVEVFDGSSSSSRMIGRFCGYSSPGFVESSGNFLWVHFRSNRDYYNGVGFKAHYTAVEVVAVACAYSGWTYDASALLNQTLTSSHYPQYGKELACSGTIRTSNVSGYVVKIVFNDFQLGYDYHRNCYNEDHYIQFYDGPSTYSKRIGTFCGDSYPEVVYSSGRYLYIDYVTERRFVMGFSLNYTVVPEGEASGICSPNKDTNDNLQLNGSSGTFFTPNYPVSYEYDTRCIWIISAHLGKKLKLNFTDFNLHFTNNCTEDFVEIRDGNSSTSRELGKYCGTLEQLEVQSTGNYLRVMFEGNMYSSGSFYSVNYAGFKAEYQAIDSSKTDPNKHPDVKLEEETSKPNKSLIIAVVVGIAVFIGIVVTVSCIAVRLRKRNERPRVTEEVDPLTPSATVTVPQFIPAPLPVPVAEDPPPPYPEEVVPLSHTAPPYSGSSPSFQGEGGDTVPSVTVLPYKEEPPPPYPLPQYPPPGELYPWQQSLNDGSQASLATELHAETSI